MKWEYKVVKSYSHIMEQKLDEYGMVGWELVLVRPEGSLVISYFKRPKQ